MTKVKRGQVWSLEKGRGDRMEVRVVRVKGPEVHAVILRTGMQVSLARRTIERGLRGARLIPPRPKNPPRKAVTASGRIVTPPKALATASDEDRRVLSLFREQKLTLTAIGERLGLSKSAVQTRLNRARWAIEDAKSLAAMASP